MATRRYYRSEPRYKDVARNEAAELQDKISNLSLWIADHKEHADPALLDMFNRKIELWIKMHDLCNEIINYKKQK